MLPLLLLGIGVAVTVVDPFAGKASGGGRTADNGAPIALATVMRRSLSSQTPLSGTLGYAASWTVALPAGFPATFGSAATYTMLPAAGKVIRRGQPLYAVNGSPTLLLYGTTPAWRRFAAGMSPGRDVAELNANLRVLGYAGATGDTFTRVTTQAIEALQQAHGLSATGTLPLGSVAFEPAAVRVTSVLPTLGQAVQPGLQPGPIMMLTSTRHDVSVQLDAAQQSQVKVGDRVLVTLPDTSTTPGAVSLVGTVATTPASSQDNSGSGGGGNGSGSPIVEVDVRLLHPAVAGTLDQAPVTVLITTASVTNALVVPVNALVALARGGYAVEEVTANGAHQLVPVTPGLFDDQAGLVQVTGSGLAVGQRVVVPASS